MHNVFHIDLLEPVPPQSRFENRHVPKSLREDVVWGIGYEVEAILEADWIKAEPRSKLKLQYLLKRKDYETPTWEISDGGLDDLQEVFYSVRRRLSHGIRDHGRGHPGPEEGAPEDVIQTSPNATLAAALGEVGAFAHLVVTGAVPGGECAHDAFIVKHLDVFPDEHETVDGVTCFVGENAELFGSTQEREAFWNRNVTCRCVSPHSIQVSLRLCTTSRSRCS